LTTRTSNYDKRPFVRASSNENECKKGWPEIGAHLCSIVSAAPRLICIECYPGVFVDEIVSALTRELGVVTVIRAEDSLKSSLEIERITEPSLYLIFLIQPKF
jgi:hypothetical protein